MIVRPLPCLIGSILTLSILAVADAQTTQRDAEARADQELPRKYAMRLDQADRVLLEAWRGFAPPAMPESVMWIGDHPSSWDELRGKVVILQSWSSSSTAGRKMPSILSRSIADLPAEDIVPILIHTPAGVDGLERYLERVPPEYPIAVDRNGQLCDDFGIYKKPVNIIIDRQGAVRYYGVQHRVLADVLTPLLAEPFDAAKKPEPRPADITHNNIMYPDHVGSVGSAIDIRGQRAPDFYVKEWVSAAPDPAGRVVVIDFWATWCGPCRQSIPHLNGLADNFRDEAVFVGLSNESEQEFEKGLRKYRLNQDSFRYPLAIDDSRRMQKAIQIRGIPHCIVMSGDWVVRWQGHPASLKAQTLRQIVDANALARGASPERPRRWGSKPATTDS